MFFISQIAHLSDLSTFHLSDLYTVESRKEKKIFDNLARKNAAVYEKDLAKVLSFIDKYIPDNAIEKIVYKCAVKTNKTRDKKLRNLTKNVTWPLADTETVHNLFNVTLMIEEYGL